MRHTAKEVVEALEDFINMTRACKTDAQYKHDKEVAKEHLITCYVRAWTVVAEKVIQAREEARAKEKTKPIT